MNYADYASTDRQREVAEAVAQCGGKIKAAARQLGVKHPYVSRTMKELKQRAALKGYSPEHDMTHTVPDGFRVKGVSTFYDDEGKPVRQWVKSEADKERQQELLREALRAMADDLPKVAAIQPPKVVDSRLANCYVITDYHLGMNAWGEETGADWDLEIAEQTLYDWFAAAVAMAPPAEIGIFAQLGDFMHWDGLEAVTPTSRHVLDADTRFQKVVRVAIRVIRRVINLLLTKHQRVHLIMADANHDPASGVWLREWLSAIYSGEPRITVDRSADTYYCFEHGLTSLFFHHGHKRKVANIDDVFAAKFRETFGRTKYSYAHMGHLHSVDVKETNLMLVEQHRTLAAPDAYASRGGWISGRDAKVITYCKEFGEVSRVTISQDMVARGAA